MKPIPFAAENQNPPPPVLLRRRGFASDRGIPARIAVALLFLAFAGAAPAQSPGGDHGAFAGGNPSLESPQRRPTPEMFAQSESSLSLTSLEREKLWKRLNADRRQSIASDVQRLLNLASELSAQLGDASQTAPSPEELRTVKEIQKLARKVKENMTVVPLPE